MPLFGVLPIDKPVGMTSHDVVDVIRNYYEIKRVGHTGTLDPAASGLLLIVLGKATRVASFLSAQDKTYAARLILGATSDSGDSEGVIIETEKPTPARDEFEKVIRGFTGTVELSVPALASVRSHGRRRHELARGGKDVPEMKRESRIREIDLLAFDPPLADIRVRCSSGTYIRSLAEAIGEKAGCGAYLGGLRREAVGDEPVEGAYTLEYLAICRARDEVLPVPEPIENYLPLPSIEVTAESDQIVHHGQRLTGALVTGITGGFLEGDVVAIKLEGTGIAAVGKALVGSDELSQEGFDKTTPIISYQCVLI